MFICLLNEISVAGTALHGYLSIVCELNTIQSGIENSSLRPPAAMWHLDQIGDHPIVMRRQIKPTISDAASSIGAARATLETNEDHCVAS